jgi:Zn finger protein HypA/HybF involved in hydrogenase expression
MNRLFRPVRTALLCAGLLMVAAGAVPAQDSPHGKIAFACEECHSADSWKVMPEPTRFDHRKTGFALKGEHAQAGCMDCHTSLTFRFKKSSARCADCHDDVHRGELGATCDRCHAPQSWLVPDMVQRHASTRFSLVGAHATVPCQQCHPSQQKNEYVGLRTDCFGCHASDYDGAQSPNHRQAGLGTDCQSCHAVNAMSWGGTFDHARTGFPLIGAHAAIACAQCHTGNVFRATATQCISCHGQQFATATSPPHTGFATDCTTCHTMSAWQPATFNHNKTLFPLTGGHMAVTCQQCHVNNVYAGLTTDCYTCHTAQFTSATTPVAHTGFPTACATCHTTNPGWTPSTFNHNNSTFPLTGAHPAVACVQCHVNNVYVGLPVTCYGCHQQLFTTANAPPHTGFSTDCTTCHTTAAWQPATFNHNNTPFPLTGGHTTVVCAQCHVNNVYAGLTTDCYTCHTAQFTSATTPVPHTGFPTACASCHTTNPGWTPSTFNHNNSTFPLTGAHPAVACVQCHVNNVYVGLPVTCYGCHQQLFTTANAPPHTGFSTDCTTCHTTAAWQPATFNHNNTPFPLTGGHTTVVCAQCHVNNVYAGLTTDCYTCHTAQFTSATTPVPHTGFPTACATCHTTNPGWTPSTYSHAAATPRFPQDSRHSTAACAKCHQTATNYTQYCCQSSGCHNSCQGGG